MNQTTNYALPQWEADDRVKRGDFNSAMSLIDAALASLSGEVKIGFGSYVGVATRSVNSGTTTHSLGYTPKVLILIGHADIAPALSILTRESDYHFLISAAGIYPSNGSPCRIVEGGFTTEMGFNDYLDKTEYYVAFY